MICHLRATAKSLVCDVWICNSLASVLRGSVVC